MRRVAAALPVHLLVAAALAACARRGLIDGRVQPIEGGTGPATPVAISWQADAFGSSGALSLVMPDGEAFAGRYLEIRATATGFGWGVGFGPGPGWGAPWWGGAVGPWGPWAPWAAGPDWTTWNSGRAEAMLFGDRGHTMRCGFRLASPGGGMSGGGIGECESSAGAKIDATF